MKPFDIQKAREGHPVCTRDGRKARIICWDKKCSDHKKWFDHHIVALVTQKKGGEAIEIYTDKGKRFTETESVLDLMMASVKHEGWVNVFNDGNDNYTGHTIYATKEEAEAYGGRFRIAIAKIEWEE